MDARLLTLLLAAAALAGAARGDDAHCVRLDLDALAADLVLARGEPAGGAPGEPRLSSLQTADDPVLGCTNLRLEDESLPLMVWNSSSPTTDQNFLNVYTPHQNCGGAGKGHAGDPAANPVPATVNCDVLGNVLAVRGEGEDLPAAFVGNPSKCGGVVRLEWDLPTRVRGFVVVNGDPSVSVAPFDDDDAAVAVPSPFVNAGGLNGRYRYELDGLGLRAGRVDIELLRNRPFVVDEIDYCPGPSVEASLPGGALVRNRTARVELTFARPVFGLEAGDFEGTNVRGVTLTASSDSDLVYFVDVEAEADGGVELRLPGNACHDEDGSGSFPLAAGAAAFEVDTDAPVAELAPASGAAEHREAPVVVNLTFSEPVDLLEAPEASGGAAVAVTAGAAGDRVYTLEVTPPDSGGAPQALRFNVTVRAGGAADAAGNPTEADEVLELLYDDEAPVPALLVEGTPTADGAFAVLVDAGEALREAPSASSFALEGELGVTGVETVAGGGGGGAYDTYRVRLAFLGDAAAEAAGSVTLLAGALADLAGNVNADNSSAAAAAFDPVPPVVTLEVEGGSPTSADPAAVLLTFSEPPASAPLGSGVSVEGGASPASAGALEEVSPTVFRLALDVDGSGERDLELVVSLPEGYASDEAGNPTAAASLAMRHDSRRPRQSGPAEGVSPTSVVSPTVTLRFDEPVAGLNASGLALGAPGSGGAAVDDVVRVQSVEPVAAGAATHHAEWRVTLQPVEAEFNFTVEVRDGAVRDEAGNPGAASTGDPAVFQYNRGLPSVVVTLSGGTSDLVTGAATVGLLFQWDRANLTDFDAADVVATAESLAGETLDDPAFELTVPLGPASPTEARGVLTMPAGAERPATVRVSVRAGAAVDASLFASTASEALELVYDPERPSAALELLDGVSEPVPGLEVRVAVQFSEAVRVDSLTGAGTAPVGVEPAGSAHSVAALDDAGAAASDGGALATRFSFVVALLPSADEARVTVTWPGGLGADQAGNTLAEAAELSFDWDAAPPRVASVRLPDGTDLLAASPPAEADLSRVVVAFDEPVEVFRALAVVVEGDGVSVASVERAESDASALLVRLSFGAAGRVPLRLTVLPDLVRDAAGNANEDSREASAVHDVEAPAVTLALAGGGGAAVTNENPFEVLVTFSEPVSGFTALDVAVDGGTATIGAGGAPGGAEFGSAFVVRVEADLPAAQFAVVRVSVAAGAASDAAGNPSEASAPAFVEVLVDRLAPTPSFLPPAALSTLLEASFSVSFGEPVTGLELGDFVVGNATALSLEPQAGANGNAYDLVVAPTAAEALLSLALPEGAAADAAGNPSLAARATFVYDRRNLTVEVSAAPLPDDGGVALAARDEFDVLFTFSKPVLASAFASASQITAEGALEVASPPEAEPDSGSLVFRARFRTTAALGAVAVSLAAGRVLDTQSIPNDASNRLQFTHDSRPLEVTLRADGFDPAVPTEGNKVLELTFTRTAGLALGFDAADVASFVVVDGGVPGTPVPDDEDDSRWLVTVFPFAALRDDAVLTVRLERGAFVDGLGVGSEPTDALEIAHSDTLVSVDCGAVGAVQLASGRQVTAADPIVFAFNFSRLVADSSFTDADLVVTGGTVVSRVTCADPCDALHFTVTVRPDNATDDASGDDVVDVTVELLQRSVEHFVGVGVGNADNAGCLARIASDRLVPAAPSFLLVNDAFDGRAALAAAAGIVEEEDGDADDGDKTAEPALLAAAASSRRAAPRALDEDDDEDDALAVPALREFHTRSPDVLILVVGAEPLQLGLTRNGSVLAAGGVVTRADDGTMLEKADLAALGASAAVAEALEDRVWAVRVTPDEPGVPGPVAVHLAAGALADLAGNPIEASPGLASPAAYRVQYDPVPPEFSVAFFDEGVLCRPSCNTAPGGSDDAVEGNLTVYLRTEVFNLSAVVREEHVALLEPERPDSVGNPEVTGGTAGVSLEWVPGSLGDPVVADGAARFTASLRFVFNASSAGAEAATEAGARVEAFVSLREDMATDLAGNPNRVTSPSGVHLVLDRDAPSAELYTPHREVPSGREARVLINFGEELRAGLADADVAVTSPDSSAAEEAGLAVRDVVLLGEANGVYTYRAIATLPRVDGTPVYTARVTVLEASVSDLAGNPNGRTLSENEAEFLVGDEFRVEGVEFSFGARPVFSPGAAAEAAWSAAVGAVLADHLGSEAARFRVAPPAGSASVSGEILPAVDPTKATARELYLALFGLLCADTDEGEALRADLAPLAEVLDHCGAVSPEEGPVQVDSAPVFLDCGIEEWVNLNAGEECSECDFWLGECRWWVWALILAGCLFVLCYVGYLLALLCSEYYRQNNRAWMMEQHMQAEDDAAAAAAAAAKGGEWVYDQRGTTYAPETLYTGEAVRPAFSSARSQPRLIRKDGSAVRVPGLARQASALPRLGAAGGTGYYAASEHGRSVRSVRSLASPHSGRSTRSTRSSMRRLPSRLDSVDGRRAASPGPAQQPLQAVPPPPMFGGPAAAAYHAGSSRNITAIGSGSAGPRSGRRSSRRSGRRSGRSRPYSPVPADDADVRFEEAPPRRTATGAAAGQQQVRRAASKRKMRRGGSGGV